MRTLKEVLVIGGENVAGHRRMWKKCNCFHQHCFVWLFVSIYLEEVHILFISIYLEDVYFSFKFESHVFLHLYSLMSVSVSVL